MKSTNRSLGTLRLVSALALGTWVAACGGQLEPFEGPQEAPSTPDAGAADGDAGPRDTGASVDGAADGPDADDAADATPTALAPIVDTDLGDLSSGVPTGFQIPPNTLGFQVVTVAQTRQPVGIYSLTAPNGVAVLDKFTPAKGSFSTTIGGDGMGAASVPVQSLAETMPTVAAGTWQMRVANVDTSPIHTRIRTLVTDDGQFHSGTLDVHLWIPEGLQISDGTRVVSLSAEKGPRQVAIQKRMDSFYQTLERLTGIGRGTVTVHSLPAEFATLEGEDGGDELTAMLESSTPVKNARAMHFFWVESTPNLSWWGIASAIPGAASSPGTPLAGVTLGTVSQADPAIEGVVMLHEMGHFVGLQHPSELNDAGDDPLEDTESCPGMTARNYQQCAGVHNVMAAMGNLETDTATLSPFQTHIVRSSLVYSALARGPAPLVSPNMPRPRTNVTQRPFGAWVPSTPLARFLAGGCAHQQLPHHPASAIEAAELATLAASPAAPNFVRARAARILR